MKRVLLVGTLALVLGGKGAQATVPCSAAPCETHLSAVTHVKHWTVPGEVGERWLLYLNVYRGGRRLEYHRLAGGCDASYADVSVSVALHACGRHSKLDYVSFAGSHVLRITYRYVRR